MPKAWLSCLSLLVAGACSGSPAPSGPGVYMNAMTPGSNGNSAGGTGFPGAPATSYPPNFADQLTLYSDLRHAEAGLQATPCTPPADVTQHVAGSNQACNYYKNEGLTPDKVVSTETVTAPSGGAVTITRDGWGVPFVDAPTRTDAMFGFGYASGEDRLWLYDVLRNIGRGRLSAFLGPSDSFYSFDSNIALVAGYGESELTAMVAATIAKFGPLGAIVSQDLDADLAGINAYIATLAGANKAKVPPEYGLVASSAYPPSPFTAEDILASAILIQSLFATGGGMEHLNELLLQEMDPTFGASSTAIAAPACTMWRDLRHATDPDATHTIDTPFVTQSPGALDESCPQSLPPGAAVWDVGSFKTMATFTLADSATQSSPGHTLTSAGMTQSTLGRVLAGAVDPVRGAREGLRRSGFGLPDTLSNFIAVTADRTKNHHPIAVMGPQASYYVPQLLWEVGLHSNGGTAQDFDGRGIVFANLPYIEIGRGKNYAWSATSGGSDLTDVRVSTLCDVDGSAPSLNDADGDGFPDATGYVFDAGDGQGPLCRALYKRTDTWTATPTLASIASGGPSAPQLVTRRILRTHYGPVFATATASGAPVAVSLQRSTFGAELDTAVVFAFAATPTVHDATSFQHLFNSCTGTFNWLYVDPSDVAYLHAGLYPVRDPMQSPDLPVWGDGRFEWASDKGLPASFFTTYGGTAPFPARVVPSVPADLDQGNIEWQGFLPLAQHPQAVNPSKGWIASWNNAPAPGWWAADGRGSWGPTHRVDELAKRLDAFAATGRKFDFGNMAEVAADAAFTDLRGQEVLPLLLQIMQAGSLDATEAQVVQMMQAWMDAGSGPWISGQKGFGAWRRDRDGDGFYDQRQQVLLMDAWYPHLIQTILPQVTAIDGATATPLDLTSCSGLALQCRYDAPRAQGSAFESGYYEFIKRVLQMALGTPGHTDYRALKCAGTGDVNDCRSAVLTALTAALTDLGGLDARASWDGTTLQNVQTGKTGETVETYDAIQHTGFSLLGIPPIQWMNRPTFQQVVEPH